MIPPALSIRDLVIAFPALGGKNYCVQNLSYEAQEGEVLGIVGESGCGKSLHALAVMGILPPQAQLLGGVIDFHGIDVLKLSKEAHRKIRAKEMAMIFQNPMSSLNPYLKIGTQLTETLRPKLTQKEANHRAIEALERVRIADAKHRLAQYPHELSGGMCQRVMIAMALIKETRLLIADEPTTALDVTIQIQILNLLSRLIEEDGQAKNMTMILISHDIGVIANMADRILVMYAGSAMELGETKDVLSKPRHPYTAALLTSVPDLYGTTALTPIPGNPPLTHTQHRSCPFHPRCAFVQDCCRQEFPIWETRNDRHFRCFCPLEDQKKGDS